MLNPEKSKQLENSILRAGEFFIAAESADPGVPVRHTSSGEI